MSSETVNPAAWEYLYCVRKYLVDETGQDKVRSCCCSDPTLSVAWLHNLGSAIRSVSDQSVGKAVSQSVASGQSRRPPDGKGREGLIKPFSRQ